MCLDFLVIDKAAFKECGVITLDLILRAGVLLEDDNRGWKLAPNYYLWHIYLFDDAKTIESITKFVQGMQSQKVMYSVANLQADVCLDTMTCVCDLLGDCDLGSQRDII